MRLISIPILIFAIITTVILPVLTYTISKDVESVAHRAKVAANASDMLQYMKQLKSGMVEHNMTSGHTTLIFKTPSNDLGLLTTSIDRIIERLEAMESMPNTEVAYQVALDDIRGTISALRAPTVGFVWVRYFPLCAGCILSWIALFRLELWD